jgi:hypothetical protein
LPSSAAGSSATPLNDTACRRTGLTSTNVAEPGWAAPNRMVVIDRKWSAVVTSRSIS